MKVPDNVKVGDTALIERSDEREFEATVTYVSKTSPKTITVAHEGKSVTFSSNGYSLLGAYKLRGITAYPYAHHEGVQAAGDVPLNARVVEQQKPNVQYLPRGE